MNLLRQKGEQVFAARPAQFHALALEVVFQLQQVLTVCLQGVLAEPAFRPNGVQEAVNVLGQGALRALSSRMWFIHCCAGPLVSLNLLARPQLVLACSKLPRLNSAMPFIK